MPEYEGTFNFQGENNILTTTAHNQDHAYLKFISVLSKRYSLAKRALLYHFNGARDNYYIKEVKNGD